MRRLGALVGAVTLVAALVTTASAAPKPDTACWFMPNQIAAGGTWTMTAVNLPDEYAATWGPSFGWPLDPAVSSLPGTAIWVGIATNDAIAYIWQRGGGRSLIKAGPRLNDYHVIAMCSLIVEGTT